MRISIIDVSLAQDDSGEPRVNLGDVTSGKGLAAAVPIWGSGDGFLGIPNGPDGSNQAPQAIMGQDGYRRFALAIRDPRFVAKAGQLAEGDRAVVSNCDASLILRKTANTIGLQSTGASCVVSSGQVQAVCGSTSLTVGSTSVNAQASGGGALGLTNNYASLAFLPTGVNAEVNLTPTGLTLIFQAGGPLCSIALTAAGAIAIVAPGGVTVNGVPLVFSGGAWV